MPMTSTTVYGPARPRLTMNSHAASGDHFDHSIRCDTPLHIAVRNSDVSSVISLLDHGVDVEAHDAADSTPLYISVEKNDVVIACLLIERGAQVNKRFRSTDEYRPQTVLRMAARNGHIEMVQSLIDRGADVNGHPDDFPPPLSCALRGGHVDVVRWLLERGADLVVRSGDQFSALHDAVVFSPVSKRLEIISLLLTFGASADAVDIDGQSVLSLAIAVTPPNLAVLRMLLAHGADRNTSSAVHAAAKGGNFDIMRLLVESGADVTASDSSGRTVLHNAVSLSYHRWRDHNQAGLVRLLIDHGADPNGHTKDGLSPIYLAAGHCAVETISTLLEHGAKMEGLVQGVETVLHRSIRGENVEVARFLLEKGANRHALDKDGISAVQLARMLGRTDIMRVFGLQPAGLPLRDMYQSHDSPYHASAEPFHNEATWASDAMEDWCTLADAHYAEGRRLQRDSESALEYSADGKPDEGSIALGTSYALDSVNRALVHYDMAYSCDPEGVFCLERLFSAYYWRYQLTKDAADLDKAIEYGTQTILTTPRDVDILYVHASALLERYEKFSHSPTDLDHAMQTFRTCTFCQDGHNRVKRFQAARAHADLSLVYKDAAAAMCSLQIAVDLMQVLSRPAAKLKAKHFSLSEYIRNTPGIAVSVALDANDILRALEWFEHGRCVVWSHMLRLQTSVEDLRNVDPALAEQNRGILAQLHTEELTIDKDFRDPSFLQSSMRHTQLESDLEVLATKARKLPGLEGFLMPKVSSELRIAAVLGPVILLNVAEHRCDAMILQYNCEGVRHISLPFLIHDSLRRIVNNFRECLRGTDRLVRGNGTAHRDTSPMRMRATSIIRDESSSLERVLRELWERVVQPVFQELQLLRSSSAKSMPLKRLPRITWCVSGALAFLPLHAAGIYDRDQPSTHNAMNYAVHSYTPSLSALVEALRQSRLRRDHDPKPSILAVSQPATPGHKPLPGTLAEISAIQVVAKNRLTLLSGPEATQSAVLALLDRHPWVHLACHGVQDAREPTHSAFVLHDGNLTLHALVRRALTSSAKSLAVLSACQTAAGDVTVPEEVLHLAAGMLTTGFQSVAATMWSIDDYDAPIVMEALYDYLLNKANGDSTQSSYALHYAVGRLRETVGVNDVLRWAPFIHLGV